MKVLIIEDEPAAAKRLEKMVTDLKPKTEILEILDSIDESVRFFKERPQPELIFCDIQLADGQCFEIFQNVKVTAPVIFTTAYDQYAIEAFKVNSIDYLLKPVKKEELAHSFEKLDSLRLAASNKEIDYSMLAEAIKGQQKDYSKRFLIRFGQNIKAVDVEDVAYFYTEEKSIFLRTNSGKTYTIDDSLEKLDEILDPQMFFRINRQTIVNLKAIDEMYAYSKSRVKIRLKPAYQDGVIVSTERSPHFKKWLAREI